jgi:threonine dehydrogenase-like Zn-dependent dehydrogenase
MRAITVAPGVANSIGLEERPEPGSQGKLLVEAVALGICGTDIEILKGVHGAPPRGERRMVLGHESLGRIVEAPPGADFGPGDMVVGIVRRPDPVPCPACAGGEWDMCENGLYTERGIKGLDGFGSERFVLEPEFAVRVEPSLGITAVLLEPASVLAKAWDHIERIGRRTKTWSPRRVLVTGAGPVGLLAALMAVQRGYDLHVYDRATEGPKPALVTDLGGSYHCDGLEPLGALAADVVLECTGAGTVVRSLMQNARPSAILCLTGLSSAGRKLELDVAGLNRSLVLENNVVFGSVNANREHYELAAAALANSDKAWLERVISRRVPLRRWQEAYERRPDDVKVIIDFTAEA